MDTRLTGCQDMAALHDTAIDQYTFPLLLRTSEASDCGHIAGSQSGLCHFWAGGESCSGV